MLFTTVVTTIKRNYDVKIRQTISELDGVIKLALYFMIFVFFLASSALIYFAAAFRSSMQHVNVDLVYTLNKITII